MSNINSVMKEFKAFILKGNIIDMAVGVIIGGAFSKIVDVYKRQVWKCSSTTAPFVLSSRVTPASSESSFSGISPTESIRAVSYTHLDVYKRQAEGPPGPDTAPFSV